MISSCGPFAFKLQAIDYHTLMCWPCCHVPKWLSMALPDAMTKGVPAIVSRVGRIPKVLKDDACGYLIEPRDDAARAHENHGSVEDMRYRDPLVVGTSEHEIERRGISKLAEKQQTSTESRG